MQEAETVKRTETLATIESLKADLLALGVQPGMVLLVHSSLSSVGWVCGGAVAVILALEEALGSTGTLIMPAHSTSLTEPSRWENPPVPESWWEVIRQNVPAFDPDLTPTRAMGAIPETFRKQRGVIRSAHPHHSFCARGERAEKVVGNHLLPNGLGEGSPLARIYELDGWVLLLGVDHARNTSMHLAEYRSTYPSKKVQEEGAPVWIDGKRQWTTFEEINLDSSDFAQIGEDFLCADGRNVVVTGRVGQADCQLMPQRQLVDFAADWMEKNRTKDA